MSRVEGVQVTRLPSGLTVASVFMPGRASVSLGLWLATGGRHEAAEANGVCHFIEHMLFKGTRRRNASQISQAVEGVGGYLNAFTGEESTCFYARARYDQLELLLDVLSDMLLGSRFAAGELERERGVIQEEISMYLDQPHQHVQELLNAAIWPDQPLGRSLTGSMESVQRLKRGDLIEFQRKYFNAGSTVLVAAGQVSHDRLVRLARRYLRGLPEGGRQAFAPVVEKQDGPRVVLQTKDVEQTQLVLGLRVCSRFDSRRFALRLANAILGENMSSRLFQVVREKHGMAYSIYSSLSHYADTGLFAMSAGLDARNVGKALELVLGELKRLSARPPGRAEFERARDYVLGQMDLSLENTENRMNWVGEQLTGYDRVSTEAAVRRRVAQVTPTEVSRVMREYCQADRMSLALVGPMKSAAGLKRMLAGY
ncbi:MAG: hypothetical protein RI897_2091 [Verrucomicrobiota bacterium]